MDLSGHRVYEFEAWSQSMQPIADISALMTSRTFTMARNDVEELTFTLDLDAFENYCLSALGGINPVSVIDPYVTYIMVKRNGVYLFGTQVDDVHFSSSPDETDDPSTPPNPASETGLQNTTVDVTCHGYLNLLKDRYVTQTYTGVEPTTIGTGIIGLTQATTNGNLGITIAPSQYLTGAAVNETYQKDNVKSSLQTLTTLPGSSFDFGFNYLKVFQTYQQIGARRGDINLIWGGPQGNVTAFDLDKDATSLYNYIYGLGSGSGTDQLEDDEFDTTSEVNYYRREDIAQFSSVTDPSILQLDTQGALSLSKDVIGMPEITITSNEVPANNFLSVGDRIPFQVQGHTWLKSVNGLFRIEQMTVTLDQNDFESIDLTFDTFEVNQNEQPS